MPLATRSLQIGLSELGERAGVIGGAYRGIEHRISVEEVDAEYFDWTKGGNGPWSDVYYRHDHKVVIGAMMRDA